MDIKPSGINTGPVAFPDKSAGVPANEQKSYTPVGATENIGFPQQKDVKKEDLEKSVDALNKWLDSQVSNTHVQFKLHEKMKEYYVQVVDDQTNEVIREIPSKKLLDINAKILEMVGLLVDERR